MSLAKHKSAGPTSYTAYTSVDQKNYQDKVATLMTDIQRGLVPILREIVVQVLKRKLGEDPENLDL